MAPPATVGAILAAKQLAENVEQLLHRVTVDALVKGAPYPGFSKATAVSTSTLQRWVRGLKVTPASRRRAHGLTAMREQIGNL